MRIRFPNHPVVDEALVITNALFGVDITVPKFPTAADREKADRFDVQKALEQAIEARKKTNGQNL